MKWEESLVSGTFARIFTEDEYRNYIGLSNALAQADLTNEEIMEIRSNMNFLGKVIFISSQTIDFTGEVTSLITSVCDGESVKENQIESPFDTKVKIAYAKTAEAQATADEAAESASQANTLAEAAQASADQAKQSADNAQSAADNAQSAVDAVEVSVASLETSVDNAQKAADNAKAAADTAQAAADTAQQSADNAAAEAETAKTNAATAQTKADEAAGSAASAQEAADDAVSKANAAQVTANTARSEVAQANEEIDGLSTSLETTKQTLEADYSKKSDLNTVQANLQAQITENAAQIEITHTKVIEVDETANDAKEKAEAAQTAAGKAQAEAAAAKTAAANAQTAADNAKTAADNAQSEADAAKTAATNAKSIADKAQEDLEAAQADLTAVTGRVDATEEDIAAAQAAVTTAQAAADKAKQDAATAQTKAETAQTAADDAATKATNAQTKADEAKTAADDASIAASKAQTDATAAKTAAANAQTAAETAQTTANTAKANAATAQSKADQAATDAATAQSTADAAKTKAENAQTDLNTVKENLEAVKSRVDATEKDIAAAEQAVQTAQSKADEAAASAAAAQSTADTAKTNAAAAQAAADEAKEDAAAAQTAADNAKTAADAAQADVNGLKTRVAKTETDIKKNADAIELTATKEEVTETLGGYYTKEEADAAIEVKADSITQTVSSTYATKQGLADVSKSLGTRIGEAESNITQNSEGILATVTKIDTMRIGSRNYALDTLPEKIAAQAAANNVEVTITKQVLPEGDASETNESSVADETAGADTDAQASSIKVLKTAEMGLTTKFQNGDLVDITGTYSDGTVKTWSSAVIGTVNSATVHTAASRDEETTDTVNDVEIIEFIQDVFADIFLEGEIEKTLTLSTLSITKSIARWELSGDWIPAETYTVSFEGTKTDGNFEVYRDHGYVLIASESEQAEGTETAALKYDTATGRYYSTFTCPAAYAGTPAQALNTLTIHNSGGATADWEIKLLKLEKGNKQTDWTPAPEDASNSLEDSIDKVNTETSSINQTLDKLGIPDGVSTVNDKGEVVSDGDNLFDALTKVIKKSTEIDTNADKVEMRFQTVEEAQKVTNSQLADEIATRKNYITFSDSGITLGQTEGESAKYRVVITNTGINFVYIDEEAETVPAYINSNKLHIKEAEIENGEIENDLWLGGFRWFKRANGNLALKYDPNKDSSEDTNN